MRFHKSSEGDLKNKTKKTCRLKAVWKLLHLACIDLDHHSHQPRGTFRKPESKVLLNYLIYLNL